MSYSSVNSIDSTHAVSKPALKLVLSEKCQSAIFLALGTMIIWTVFFSTYPPVHDMTHGLRHGTFTVACH